MRGMDEFLEMLEGLCTRRSMYVRGGTFAEICAYLDGYVAAADLPFGDGGWHAFSRFVCARYGFPDKYWWSYVLHVCSQGDDDGCQQLHTVLAEFCEKIQSSPCDQVIEQAHRDRCAESDNDGEPERAFRSFLSALLQGNKETIESLICPHPDASVLFQSAYPADVAVQLDAISNASAIGRIPATDDSDEVRLITADFPFAIPVRLVQGKWLVDAAAVIELWQDAP